MIESVRDRASSGGDDVGQRRLTHRPDGPLFDTPVKGRRCSASRDTSSIWSQAGDAQGRGSEDGPLRDTPGSGQLGGFGAAGWSSRPMSGPSQSVVSASMVSLDDLSQPKPDLRPDRGRRSGHGSAGEQGCWAGRGQSRRPGAIRRWILHPPLNDLDGRASGGAGRASSHARCRQVAEHHFGVARGCEGRSARRTSRTPSPRRVAPGRRLQTVTLPRAVVAVAFVAHAAAALAAVVGFDSCSDERSPTPGCVRSSTRRPHFRAGPLGQQSRRRRRRHAPALLAALRDTGAEADITQIIKAVREQSWLPGTDRLAPIRGPLSGFGWTERCRDEIWLSSRGRSPNEGCRLAVWSRPA
jgi:hypothetical protein